ncbi:MAG: TraB/GumN family protein [Woeseiaceae bacterium]|nr:TraB/GumN family protein [Woeseiaceae bacterium]
MRKLFLIAAFTFATVAVADSEHPLTLWQVDGKANTVFILGSVHLLRQQDHPLPSKIDEAYAQAESIVMEIDMDDLDPIAMQSLISELGRLTDGRTLADIMGPELYAEAQVAAAAMDIPLDLLAQTEPWLAAITIEQMALARIGFNPRFGIEMHVMAKAAQDGKTIDGLETIEEQLGFLDGLSVESQRDLLMQTLSEGMNIETMMDALITAWRHGDIDFFEDNVLDEMLAYPELYRAIVADRNERWVTHIDRLLEQEDDYLVVVGALHLVGPDGVPQLLEARGEQVRQLQQSE